MSERRISFNPTFKYHVLERMIGTVLDDPTKLLIGKLTGEPSIVIHANIPEFHRADLDRKKLVSAIATQLRATDEIIGIITTSS